LTLHLFINNFAPWSDNWAQNRQRNAKLSLNKYFGGVSGVLCLDNGWIIMTYSRYHTILANKFTFVN